MLDKKELNILLIVTLLLGFICFLAIYPYSHNFHKYDFSDKPNDWGSYGDYIGGVLNSIFAFVNIIILIFLTLYIRAKDDNDKIFELTLIAYKEYKQLKIEIELIEFSHDTININYLNQVKKQVLMLSSYDMLFKADSLRELYLKGINGSIEVLKTMMNYIENSSKDPKIDKVIKKIEKKLSKLPESEQKEQLLNELNIAKDLQSKILAENEKMQQLNELFNLQLEMVGFPFEFLMIQNHDYASIITFNKEKDKKISEIMNNIGMM